MIELKTIVAKSRAEIVQALMDNAIPDPANTWLNPFQIKFKRTVYTFRAGLSEARAMTLRRNVLRTPVKYFEREKT